MRLVFCFFLLLISAQLLTCNCFCQEISFSRISVNDGLSTNFVNTVCQDKKGFLWVGTESGLQRYDGNSFATLVASDPSKRLPGFSVDQLIPDTQRNVIWVRMGTIIGKFYTDKGEFIKADISLKLMPNGSVPVTLTKDSKDHIIFVVGYSSVLVYNDAKNAFEENSAVITIPGKFSILNIYEDTEHGWFYLCGAEGLKIFDTQRKAIYDADNNPLHLSELSLTKKVKFVQYVYIDSKKRFWIKSWDPHGTQDLFLLNKEENKLELKTVQPDLEEYMENLNMKESNGLLLCYGTNLLNVYDDDEGVFFKFYTKNNTNTGITFSVVKDTYEDRDNNLWVITDNGLYQAIIGGEHIHHAHLENLNGAPIAALQPTGNSILLASWGQGIQGIKYDEKNLKISDDNGANSPAKIINAKTIFPGGIVCGLWDILNDTLRKRIVVACQTGGLITYDINKKTAVFSRPEIFGGSTVRQLAEDKYGNYWYGTQSGKIVKEVNGVFTLIDDYNYAFISKLMIDDKQRLWVCTAGTGLKVIDTKTNKTIASYNNGQNKNSSIASNEVGTVLQLNDSIFIIVLVRNFDILNIKTNTFTHITTNEGLPNNTIYTLVKDKHSNVWMSTNDGIIKYNYYKNEFHSYNKKDGLVSVANNDDLLYSSCVLNNNYLMFAGAKSSYIIFNPDSVGNRKIPKDVSIADLRLFNTFLPVDSVMQSGSLNLDHNQNTITINFTVLSYGANTLSYYYRLRGASDQWIHAVKPYAASYASLAPGDYTFEVKCMNENGIESKHITSLKINIQKAYWQTWWFIGLIVIAAFIPVYIIYKLRLRRFEEVQKIREKVARDLHDDVGSTLTSINILSEISKDKVSKDNSEVKDYLSRISNTSSQMMDAMDDIVWNIKPANDTMIKIAARMREYAAAVFEPKDIAYRFVNEEKVKTVSLNMDVRRSLFLIFKETLNNISKYANANLVTIEFELKNNQLCLVIIDDGTGFDEKTIVYGNGIENMQKRAKSFKGNYIIKSYPGKGTHVSLAIPLSKYYT